MSEKKDIVLSIKGFVSNGEVAIESYVFGEPEHTFNVLVYGLVSSIRKIIDEDTVVEGVPHSSWAINEYRKEFLQEVFQEAYKVIADEVKPIRVEENVSTEESEE